MDSEHVDLEQLCSRLAEKGRVELAAILETHWNTPLKEYSQLLWSPKKLTSKLEPELIQALSDEFSRIGASDSEASAWAGSLERTRVLQTATHLTASEGPTFLAIHELAMMGLPESEYYLIGACSGVPYANAAWSGCLNVSTRLPLNEIVSEQAPGYRDLVKADQDRSRDSDERRVSLIPGKFRDAQVFRSCISEKQEALLPHLCEALKRLTPPAREGESFSAWASLFCHRQSSELFPGRKVVYFDFNEVIRSYLVRILPDRGHPLTKILLEEEWRNKVLSAFGSKIPFFSVNASKSNRSRLEPVICIDNQLNGTSFSCKLDEKTLMALIYDGTLCPGLFISFTILSFLNGITCLGSFEQIEYLSHYQQTWASLDLLNQDILSNVNTRALSCGRKVDVEGIPVYPLDLLLGCPVELPEHGSFGEWMFPLFPRLGLSGA